MSNSIIPEKRTWFQWKTPPLGSILKPEHNYESSLTVIKNDQEIGFVLAIELGYKTVNDWINDSKYPERLQAYSEYLK